MQKEALHEAALVRWNGAPSLNYKSTQSNYYPHLTMFGSHLHSHTSRFRHPCPNSASLLLCRMYTRKESRRTTPDCSCRARTRSWHRCSSPSSRTSHTHEALVRVRCGGMTGGSCTTCLPPVLHRPSRDSFQTSFSLPHFLHAPIPYLHSQ